MAEPGDPNAPETPAATVDPAPVPAPQPDLDDAVGFASAAHLEGRAREAETPPVVPEAEPELTPVLAEPPPPAAESRLSAAPLPDWARETPRPAGYAGLSTRRETPAEVPGGMGLMAVYALILFAVPTLGVSAVIALLAVTGRPAPQDPLAAGHFVFQQRTLWAGAVAALLGAILIVVGLGVFVLFALAVWLILRGTGGVLKLKAGRPIANPRTWLL